MDVPSAIKYYYEIYAQGTDDKRAVENYCVCESDEMVRSFRGVLMGIANGDFNSETLNSLLGRDRVVKYGSYDEWAKLMLRWMAEARKHP